MWDLAIRRCFCDLHRGAILSFCVLHWRRARGQLDLCSVWADKVHWLSPIFGKQLACDCGQSMFMLRFLMNYTLVTSGAMTNEGWEFSVAPFGKNFIPDSTGAPSWYTSLTSSVYNKTQSAWPESWTRLCIEMRSFQCRCFWNMLPDNSVLSHSFRQEVGN